MVDIMDWVPIVFIIFKVAVLGIGMFYAIKWHYDQGKKGKQAERNAVLRASGKVAALFVISLLVLGVATIFISRMMGLELSFS